MTFPRSLRVVDGRGECNSSRLAPGSTFESQCYTASQFLCFHCLNETHVYKLSNQPLLIKRFIYWEGKKLPRCWFQILYADEYVQNVQDFAATHWWQTVLLLVTLECEVADVG